MAITKVFLLLAVVAGSLAGPISFIRDPTQITSCIAQCPITDLPKQGFRQGTTYHYSYTGTAMTQMLGVSQNASASLVISADVELSFFSICQASVFIKNPVINGKTGDHITEELLSAHPMIVTMSEGVVTGVCAHPEDHPTGLNMKKGIISSIQNSLPHFENGSHDNIIVEDDVLGKCPTLYRRSAISKGEYVYKAKDHKQCTKDSPIAEAPMTSWWMKAPIPVKTSNSSCIQLWSPEKVLKEVSCIDLNILELIVGTDRPIFATQWSTLKLNKVEQVAVKAMEKGRSTKLSFEEIPQPKTEEVLPRIETLLRDICRTTENIIMEDAATDIAKMISLLHRVPENKIKEILSDIQSGKFCKNSHRLESIFKDALMFVNNGGAVEVMVEEVLSGKVSGGRTPMYTIALQLTKRPCIHAVKSVSRLFDSSKAPSSMVLAAGTLISKYCKFHRTCMTEPAVLEIMSKLSRRLETSCSSTQNDEEKKIEVLTALKAIGNMANISQPLEKSILRCVKAKEADIMVRVAAAQSFRQSSCQHQPTSELVKLVVNPQMETEVRIASYIASISCSTFEESAMILKKISEEANTQVRSFILSHMRNLQRSDAPYLRGLRYNLSSLIIPNDYEKDLRMYSRNIDASYYLPTIGIGAGVDTNIIYAPGSYIPRQYQANFTANIFDNVINIGEFAVRMEDIEVLFEMVFGPNGYFHNKSHAKIIDDLSKMIHSNGKKLHQHFQSLKNSKNSHEWNTINHVLNMFKTRDGQTQKPRVDAFIRVFGQELSFSSLMGDIRHVDTEQLVAKLAELSTKLLLKLVDIKVDTARLLQTEEETFIVTQQGIPLQFKLVMTGLSALRTEGGVALAKSTIQSWTHASYAVNGFIGYTLGAKAGIRLRSKGLIDTPVKMTIDTIEEKAVLRMDMMQKGMNASAELDIYCVFKMPSEKDNKTAPLRGSYPELHYKDCMLDIPSDIGMKVCWDVIAPDFYGKKSITPLGYLKGNFTTSKANPNKEILAISTSWKKTPSEGSLSFQLDFPGADKPRKGELEMEYKDSTDLKSLKLYIESNQIQRSLRVDIEPKTSRDGRKYEMTLYSGKQKSVSSADKILITRVGGKSTDKEVAAEFELKTQNSLENYLKAHVEFDATLKLHENSKSSPKSIDLRKFEVDIAVPKYFRTINFIKQKPMGANRLQYQLQSMVTTPKRELFKMTGLAKVEGSIEKNNFNSSIEIDAKCEEKTYKTEAMLVSNRREMRVMTRVRREGAAKNLFLVDMFGRKDESSSPEWKTAAKVEIPCCHLSHSLEGVVKQQSSSEYRIKLSAKKENKPLYEIEGPVIWIMKDNRLKEQCDLTIKDLRKSGEFQIVTKLNFSPEKSMAKLDVKKSGKQVVLIEGDLASKDLKQLTCSIGVHVPQIMEVKIKVDKTPARFVEMILNGFWKPNTPESQRIKGASSIDLRQKEIKIKMSYDADRDTNRMVMGNLHYDYKTESKYASAKGELSLGQKKYLYSSEIALGALSSSPNKRNELKIKIMKPDGEVFLIETNCLVEKDSSSSKKTIEYQGTLQYAANKLYKVDSKFTYDLVDAPLKMLLKGRAEMAAPQMKELVIVIDSDVDLVSKDLKLAYKMEISGSPLKKPVKTDIDILSIQSTKRTDVKINVDSTNLKLHSVGHSTKNSHQEIDTLSLEVALQLPNERTYKLKTEKDSNRNLEISLMKNGDKILAWEHSSEEAGKWRCRLTVPSRVVEVHSKVSSDEVKFALYPHRDQNQDKYEVSGHYSGKGSAIDAGAKILYPGCDKAVAIKTSMDLQRASCEGTLELDIFKDPKDKIYVHVNAMKLEQESYKVVAVFEIPTSSSSPRIIAEAGLSPKVKMFRFFLEDGSSSKPIINCVINYNRPSDNHAYIYVNLKTPSDQVEMTAALQGHELYKCRGGSLNGTINFSNKTMYDFASSACAPGYIEMGVKESSANKMFLVKLGMKNPASAKLALDLVYNSTKAFSVASVSKLENTLNLYGKHIYLPKKPVILLGAKLWAPMMVSLDAKYEVKEVNEYLDDVLKPILRNVREISKKIFETVPREISEKLPWSSFSFIDELKKFKDEIFESANKIWEEIKSFWPFPSVEHVKEIAERMFQSGLEAFKNVAKKIENYLESIFGTRFEDIQVALRRVDVLFKKTLKTVHEKSEEILRALKEGRSEMMKIKWMKWIIEEVEATSIWSWFMEKIEELEKEFEEEFQAIKDFFNKFYQNIMNEIKSILDKLSDFGVLTKFIKWLESWLFDHEEASQSTLVASIVKKYYGLYIDSDEAFLRVQIPLRRPVSSLVAALPSIGLPGHSCIQKYWRAPSSLTKTLFSPSTLTKTLLSPYTASAKITPENIVTFDGVVVPFVNSDCQIKMAAACGTQILVTKRNSQKSEVVVKSPEGATIKIHFNAGLPPTVEGIAKSNKEIKKPGLTARRVSPNEVKVESKCFELTLNSQDIEIEALPWAYNKVEGILGTHDSEKSTDIHRSSEVQYVPGSADGLNHRLTVPAAHRLLTSYKKESRCTIPSN